MDLILKIETLRKEQGLKQADMARRFNVPSQNYNNWVYRGSLPKEHYETALKLLDELTHGNVRPAPDLESSRYVSATQNVPLISWVNAGSWCETSDPYEPGDAEDWLPCPTRHSKNTYALRVVGDSMTNIAAGQRSYPPGTIIFVDPEKQPEIGSRVIAKLPETGEATFKVYTEDAGVRYLRPINPQYQTIPMPEGTKICGVVIGSYQEE